MTRRFVDSVPTRINRYAEHADNDHRTRISRDAKVLGDGVGGARITIHDVATSKVLASGITARAIQRCRVIGEAPLRYAGETSTFEGVMPALKAGAYELEVLASDGRTANAGRTVQRLIVSRQRR